MALPLLRRHGPRGGPYEGQSARARLGMAHPRRRAQMVRLSAQGMDAGPISKVGFTSEDRVRHVIRHFNADGFGSLYPKYKGWPTAEIHAAATAEIKKIAQSRSCDGGGAAQGLRSVPRAVASVSSLNKLAKTCPGMACHSCP